MEAVRVDKMESETINEQLKALFERLNNLENKIEGRSGTPKFQLPRSLNAPFKLKEKTNFDIWLKVLRSEFQSFDYEYLLDSNYKRPDTISSDEENKRIGFAKSFILTRVEDNLKGMIIDLPPHVMIKKLIGLKSPKMLSLRFAIERNWNSLTFQKDTESGIEFINRFDDLVRDLQKQGETISERELKENFLMATEIACPEITRKFDASRGELTIDELKSFLVNEEARHKEAKERISAGQVLNTELSGETSAKRSCPSGPSGHRGNGRGKEMLWAKLATNVAN